MRSSICCQRLVSCGYSVLSRSNTQVSTALKSWTGVLAVACAFIGRRMHPLDAARKGGWALLKLNRRRAGGRHFHGGEARGSEPVAAAIPVVAQFELGVAGAQDGGAAPGNRRRDRRR